MRAKQSGETSNVKLFLMKTNSVFLKTVQVPNNQNIIWQCGEIRIFWLHVKLEKNHLWFSSKGIKDWFLPGQQRLKMKKFSMHQPCVSHWKKNVLSCISFTYFWWSQFGISGEVDLKWILNVGLFPYDTCIFVFSGAAKIHRFCSRIWLLNFLQF